MKREGVSIAGAASDEWWRRGARPSAGVQYAKRARSDDNPVAFWALMTFMFILLLSPQAIFPALAPFRIALLAAAVAAGAHVYHRVAAGRPIIILTPEIKIAGCLLGWTILTIPFSYWPSGSVATLTDLFIKSLVLFWLIGNTITSVSRFRQFAWGLTLMSIPIAGVAIMNYRSGVLIEGAGDRIAGYQSPLAANPNDLALMVNLTIPFTFALIARSRGRLLGAALLALLALDVTAVVLTFSRAGFLTLAVILGITVTKLFRSSKRGWGIALVAILLLSLPFLSASYWERLATISNIESDRTGSSQARLDLVLGGLQSILSRPVVGAGIGAGVLSLRDQGMQTWNEIHNVYLQYAVDLGLPGLGLFLALLAVSLASASLARHGIGGDREARSATHLAQATWLSLIAFGAAALFYPVAYHFYFYCLAGLSTACRTIHRQGTRPKTAPVSVHPK